MTNIEVQSITTTHAKRTQPHSVINNNNNKSHHLQL